jgi:tryptophan synthase beta subunit
MLAQTLFLKEVVANLDTRSGQHGHPRVVQSPQFRVCINIHGGYIESQFQTQALQRLRHIGTQMASPPGVDSQLLRQESTTQGSAS